MLTHAASEEMLSAVATGRTAALQEALADGARPDFTRTGHTALMMAAERSDPSGLSCAMLLLDAGANPDYTNNHGWTALHVAVQQGNVPVVECLLRATEYKNRRDEQGSSPVLIAVKAKHPEVLACLLADPDISVDSANHNQHTPLMLAVDLQRLDLVDQLLARGADPTKLDSDERSALDRAQNWPEGLAHLKTFAGNDQSVMPSSPTIKPSDQSPARIQAAPDLHSGLSVIRKRQAP